MVHSRLNPPGFWYRVPSIPQPKEEGFVRNFSEALMKRSLTSYFVVVVVMFAAPLFAQTNKAKAQNVPEIPYDTVPNFLKLPAGLYLGESMGVATNSKGHVFVYTRSGFTRLFEFDQNG